MKIRWLGWAGVEVEADGERVVIDPLQDATAVFAALGDRGEDCSPPEIAAPTGGALAGMVTHLHRDHADAAALEAALAPGAPLLEPVGFGGEGLEQLAVAQADAELGSAGLDRRETAPWTSTSVGPFTLTALPAVDGAGDPQVSWLIEAQGKRVLHLGDTMFHCWWWRIAERFGAPDAVLAPINGARLCFPHRQPPSPLPGVMVPEEAALATEILGARRLLPIHYNGYELEGIYEPVADALARVSKASPHVAPLQLGETIGV
ncbi:MAG TPA: MBL fold metallo-hydrolase [Solirubrobacteraceae bacterium]|jgi:L-ascorbate metabolism protein UlaG (beta-lactamase superfamily)|nr:MBL fold metallo-hydrolase [Solirubrobacteraceae bacterium]